MRLASLTLFLALSSVRAAPPWYDDRSNLLFYLDESGDKKPIRSAKEWRVRVEHIRANMELVMGPLPAKSSEPLAVEVKSETASRHYTRRHLWFTPEKGDRVPAHLLIPKKREGKLPAMICLPQTVRIGKDEPSGLGHNTSLAYAHELAERGYVCLVLDYPLVHAVEYKTDPYQLGYVSATMKGIVNHRRGIDLLESLPFVDGEAIGVIGHSLGGHNALFLAAFDERIKAIVSSCGFNVFAKHAKGDVRAWSSKYYMPRIKTVYKDDPKKIPFDFTEVLAALAPRPVFVNAPLRDAPDFEVSGVKDCVTAATPIYRQVFNAADRLVVEHPDAGHAFPLEQRLAAYHFLDQHLRKTTKGEGIDKGILHHWPLKGDHRSAAGPDRALIHKDVDLKGPGRDRKVNMAAVLNGRTSFLEAPALSLGKGDFSLALWVHTDEHFESPGDILSQYDPEKRRGFNLSLKTTTGVTTSQPNVRQVHFGIDNDKRSDFIDCGRPGKAILPFALAVHEGHLYAGTCEPGPDESGHVYRYAGGKQWIDCGTPDPCNAVTALATFEGQLYAGVSRYKLSGSGLEESLNTKPGGRVYRYAGYFRWVDCGGLPEADSIGGLVVWRGELYASSLYKPGRFFRYEGGTKWTDRGTPGQRVEALAVYRDQLYVSSYDSGSVFRHDGRAWNGFTPFDDANQTYSFAVFDRRLHVGTWPVGTAYRLEDNDKWTDLGRLGDEREVMGMMVHNGQLYGGTLPLAEVYRFDKAGKWTKVGRIDATPDVKYRRAWTMAEFQGQLFVTALPSGKVFAFEAGRSVTWDHELSPGWRHIAAVKTGGVLKLYVDGRFAASSTHFDPAEYDLTTQTALRVGVGRNDNFKGRLSDLRLYGRALRPAEIATLAGR